LRVLESCYMKVNNANVSQIKDQGSTQLDYASQ
jgi:hypothetical protein